MRGDSSDIRNGGLITSDRGQANAALTREADRITMLDIYRAVEGGGMKCTYNAGILNAFLDHGVTFDYCIEVSGGLPPGENQRPSLL